MRSYKDAVAFAEMAIIQRKILSGNATYVEKERYRYLMQQKQSGVSVCLQPVSSPPPPLDHSQRIERDEGWHETQSELVGWKRVPRASPPTQIRPPTCDAFQATAKQKKGNIRPIDSTQNPEGIYIKSQSVAYVTAVRLAQERAARWNQDGSDKSYQVRLIAPNNNSALTSNSKKLPDVSVNGKKRLHVPIPMRENNFTEKRQKGVTEAETPASKESPSLVGILRNQKTPSLPSDFSPKIDPSAFMRAMRASQVTRGQQKTLLKALRANSTSNLTRSAFETLKSPSNAKTPQKKPSVPKKQKSSSPVSEEEATRARRLAWMRSAKEIMSQNLPPSVLKKDIKSNPNVSTTHLLRRIGNPHRRVIHQMLRDQNKRILQEMKRQFATKTASSPDASPPTVMAPAVAAAAAASK